MKPKTIVLKIYLSFAIFNITNVQKSICQTLTIKQVHQYTAGDIICTKIDNEEDIPDYAIDSVISNTINGTEQNTIKNHRIYHYNPNKGIWTFSNSLDTLILENINNPYFNRFLSKDSLSVIKDSMNTIISKLEIKDSVFKDICNIRQANYNRYYSWKKNVGDVYQTVTVYEGLGVFIQYIQNQSTSTIYKESLQFYISNGQLCGDTSIYKAFRNLNLNNPMVNKIDLWPNPFSDKLNISLSGHFDFEFIDIYGKIFYKGESDSPIIDTSEIPHGVYFLFLKQNEEIVKNAKVLK